MLKLNLVVLRTRDPEILKGQYEQLGFVFDYHQHNNGPFHFASDSNGFVFEIYPLSKSMEVADNSLRLGFEIEDIRSKIKELKNTNWKIVSDVIESGWGLTAVIQDLDGWRIELKNK